ncbi:MAG: hypothetical protein HQ582_15395 [Planctomycetes bacterium]|nr:hypothetical protein [Planctomycetota bacterium]
MDPSLLRAIDHLCDRFEEVWTTGKEPRIGAFLEDAALAETDPCRSKLLGELVIIDLEHRWKNALQGCRETAAVADGETDASPGAAPSRGRPLLEDYAREFPELGQAENLSDDLIIGEYKARWLAGDRPSHEEYGARFPHRRADLTEILRGVDRERSSISNSRKGWGMGRSERSGRQGIRNSTVRSPSRSHERDMLRRPSPSSFFAKPEPRLSCAIPTS